VITKMKKHVFKFIIGCVLCSTTKPNNKKHGLYMPLPIPSRPWEITSLDFVGCFPMSRRGHGYLFLVVDQFNKMCVLIPYNKTFTDHEATRFFFENVWYILVFQVQ
jgi:hypothetical protein